ncbi:chloride channel/carrier, CIC family [Galdieria sulphuraria]|uniref:Chloride channel protein n=1 Tax=Galdieria sulphuraria TaxID=130081 RepID=M2X4P3_GALSU|nr:chloride channel/carrier, CIC family [Galdieria sulphuraria]EME31405.1 chloride channel/carrier, CIC family [Galdieria sulphuraria]|eukprot:XP_005707925.1 chloride channel/carrier, CIC family [Galdieria sulphuraria]
MSEVKVPVWNLWSNKKSYDSCLSSSSNFVPLSENDTRKSENFAGRSTVSPLFDKLPIRSKYMREYKRTSTKRLRSVSRDRGPDCQGDFRVIDWPNESSKIKIRNGYGENSSNTRKSFVVALLLTAVGLLMGFLAAYLDIAVEWLSDLKFGVCIFLLLYTCMGAILVITLAPYAAGSGIPEVKAILNGVVMKGFLSSLTFIVKMLGVSLAVAAGLSAGKEGPYVHLGCCLCALLCSLFPLIRHDGRLYRELLACASAAGVAVAFGAPVGGVLFSLEEVSTYFSSQVLWHAFYCAFVAAMTLKVMNPYYNGKTVIFEIPSNLPWNWFEIVFFALTGAVGGILGTVFIKTNLLWMKLKEKHGYFKRHPMREILLVTLMTCFLFYFSDFLSGSNSEILTSLFNECSDDSQELDDIAKKNEAYLCSVKNSKQVALALLVGTFLKLFTAVITFGIKLPTGIFIPSLTVGGLCGRLIGVLVKGSVTKYPKFPLFRECLLSTSCVSPAIYAVTGAAAMLGGVTRVSVSLVVIMIELTNGLHYLLPVMIAVLVSKWVGDVLHVDSIYELYIKIKRYPYLRSNPPNENSRTEWFSVRNIMHTPVVCITSTSFHLSDLERLLTEYKYWNFPIITSSEENAIIGSVSREAIAFVLGLCHKENLAPRDPRVHFSPPSHLSNLHEAFTVLNDNSSSSEELVLELGSIMDFFTLTIPDNTPVVKVPIILRNCILWLSTCQIGYRDIPKYRSSCRLVIQRRKDFGCHIEKGYHSIYGYDDHFMN